MAEDINSKDNNTSAFNEAAFKMRRLHELQETCNVSRSSPLIRDDKNISGVLNHSNALVSLYQELFSKLKETEIKKIRPMIKKLISLARVINKKLPYMNNHTEKIKWYESKEGQKEYNGCLDLIFDAEEILRQYLDDHGFSTLNKEGTAGDEY